MFKLAYLQFAVTCAAYYCLSQSQAQELPKNPVSCLIEGLQCVSKNAPEPNFKGNYDEKLFKYNQLVIRKRPSLAIDRSTTVPICAPSKSNIVHFFY